MLDHTSGGYETYRRSVWGGESNPCHYGDHHVLLGIELTGVKTPRVTKSSELPGRENRFQELASRKGE